MEEMKKEEDGEGRIGENTTSIPFLLDESLRWPLGIAQSRTAKERSKESGTQTANE